MTATQPPPVPASMYRALTQEQVDSFHEHGYLRVGKILSDDEIALLRAEYDAEFEKAQHTKAFRNLAIDDGSDPTTTAKQRMLQIMQMGDRNLHFRRMWYHTKLLDIVEDIIGPNIQLFHDQALFKPAHHGGAVFWHQDNGYWKCTPASLISCWITLDDAVRENGAMQVIPGSHLKPVWHEKSKDTTALYDLKNNINESGAVVVELPAGGCMFHHCQTLHYTQPNETERQRRAFIIHYMIPGTRSLTRGGKVLGVDFSRPILRMNIA